MEQTAKALGKSKKSIQRLVQGGMLTPEREGRRFYFPKEQVDRLIKEGLADPIRELKDLRTRVVALEERVAYLTYVAGVDVTALRAATDEQLVALVQEASRARNMVGASPPGNMRKWGELFIQVSEVELLRISHLIKTPRPWEPLYVLCVEMMTEMRRRKWLQRSPSGQDLYRLLEKGRKTLGQAAIMTMEALAAEIGTSATRRLLLQDSMDDALMRIIEEDRLSS